MPLLRLFQLSCFQCTSGPALDFQCALIGADDPRAEAAEKDDEWEEAILNVSRVTKVVKGGRQVAFRADVVVGDHKGTVGRGQLLLFWKLAKAQYTLSC